MVSFAQQPFINNVAPLSAEVGTIVEIAGLNLSGSPRVFFGGVEANVTSNTNNLIQVEVPAGASNTSIFVLNNGEIAQSSERFQLSFGGTSVTEFDPEFFQSTGELAASDLCLCDLNSDGLNDVVVVHNRDEDADGAEATVFLNNTTTTGALSGTEFQVSQELNVQDHDAGFISVACADFDNDGDNDLAFTSNTGTQSNDVFVLGNTNNGNFPANPSALAFQLPLTASSLQRQPGMIRAADFDRDGFLDLVVGNSTDGTFHIFRNTRNLTFGAANEFQSEGERTSIIEVGDFNGDGYQDLATSAFRQNNISFFKNLSTINNFSFAQEDKTLTELVTDIALGDVDNDGDIDVVSASRDNGTITFFENESGSELSFQAGIDIPTTASSNVGVNLGDMNGDGLLDIVSTNLTGGIYLYRNQGNNSFGSEEIEATGSTTQFLMIGDLNNDAKPDIAFSRDVEITQVGSLGILLNRNCITPIITPQNIEFCPNEPFTLETTKSLNATYTWEVLTGNGANPTDNDAHAEFTITGGSNASIRVTITQDGCSESANLNLTVAGGTAPTNPSINVTSAGVLCTGDNVTLSSSITSDNYFWTLPDGSSAATPTIQLNPVSIEDAGTYSLYIQDNDGCISETASETIEVSESPALSILNNGLENFCDEVVLEVPDYSGDGITYQWQNNGADLGSADENNASVTVSQSGVYTVEVTNADDCTSETSSVTLNRVDLPTSIIDGPTETCVDFQTTFTAGSFGEAGFDLEYQWIVDGSEFSTANTIDLTFNNASSHTITLDTSYNPSEVYPGPNADDLCVSSETLNLTVSNPPSIEFNLAQGVEKCQGDVLNVELSSPAGNSIDSYSWITRNATSGIIGTSTDASFEVLTPAGVENVYAVVTIETAIGCTVTDSLLINNFPTDAGVVFPDFPGVTSDSIVLEDGISIRLQANNIVSGFAWEPAEFIDNPASETVTFFPQTQFNTVTLSGVDNNGCPVATSVVVELDNLRPKKTFSPNGDGLNDCWEILNIEGFEGVCEVYIFDSRGRNVVDPIKTFDQSNCVWNGTFSGTPVLEGVYYFVLKCNDDGLSKTGSILLAR